MRKEGHAETDRISSTRRHREIQNNYNYKESFAPELPSLCRHPASCWPIPGCFPWLLWTLNLGSPLRHRRPFIPPRPASPTPWAWGCLRIQWGEAQCRRGRAPYLSLSACLLLISSPFLQRSKQGGSMWQHYGVLHNTDPDNKKH